jgi:hypothetical protein
VKSIRDFLNSDIQTLQSREAYLGYARNVKAGHHATLELTGNAFNVRFLPSVVQIENLWDDEDESIEMDLEIFIQTLSEWVP